MNASYEWLHAFVPFEQSAKELADMLTMRCATVEDVIPLRSDLNEILVARVITAVPHPNSDHLTLTTVDAGTGEPISVVCGAPNVEAGAIYPYAPVGSTLPGGLKLEKKKIRGEISNGMLCSSRELGLGTDHEGILKLETDAKPGSKFMDVMKVGGTRLVIDVLPNRPDLLSHEGLAREIAAATGKPMSRPAVPGGKATTVKLETSDKVSAAIGSTVVQVNDTEGAPRYAAAVVRGVKIGPSPEWLARRIEDAGSRSINNVVDVTNYMLLGFGQPMHAFDLKRLKGNKVVVRRAAPSEKITTLDGKERTLNANVTVIADAEAPIAIAGVLGGRDSEVTEATTDILLEVAAFDPKSVRATRRALGISTDASYRFERGVNVDAIGDLLNHAVEMIVAVAGGVPEKTAADIFTRPAVRGAIALEPSEVRRIVGIDIPVAEIKAALESIGFAVEKKGSGLQVTPPSWRADVVETADIIEEVARLYGYDRIPDEIRPFRPGTVPDAPIVGITDRVRDVLIAHGLYEARPMPFVKESAMSTIRVSNPLAEDEAYLRGSILESLAKRAEHNLAHMNGNVRLFEIGTTFSAGAKGGLPTENTDVAAIVMGLRRPIHFTDPQPPSYDQWDAKEIAEAVAASTYPSGDLKLVVSTHGFLWDILLDGERVGSVQQLSLDAPVWASPAFGIEMLIKPESAGMAQMKYRGLPVTPAVEFDLALLVPENVTAEQIEESVRKNAGELLERLELFDEFKGKGIPDGFRSLAWRLTFRHPERTLRDKEIQGRTEKILKALDAELGVRKRS